MRQIILALLLFVGPVSLSAKDVYVSNDGSDNNAGTREKPFASIQKALTARCLLCSSNSIELQECYVQLRHEGLWVLAKHQKTGERWHKNSINISRNLEMNEGLLQWSTQILGSGAGFPQLLDEITYRAKV